MGTTQTPREFISVPVFDPAAFDRSMELLDHWFTPEQREQWSVVDKRRRSFNVVGGDTGARYRITGPDRPYDGVQSFNVRQFCACGQRGLPLKDICFVPRGNRITGDVLLTQKLGLELDELASLAVANVAMIHNVTPERAPTMLVHRYGHGFVQCDTGAVYTVGGGGAGGGNAACPGRVNGTIGLTPDVLTLSTMREAVAMMRDAPEPQYRATPEQMRALRRIAQEAPPRAVEHWYANGLDPAAVRVIAHDPARQEAADVVTAMLRVSIEEARDMGDIT